MANNAHEHAATDSVQLDDLRIEILQPSDEVALSELFQSNNVPEVIRFFDPFPLDADTAHRLTRYEGRDRHWGVWAGDALIGLAMVRGWDSGHPEPTYGLLIDRGFRYRGVSTHVTRLVEREIRAMGEQVIRARVHDDNGPVLRALEKVGWLEIGRSPGRILYEARLAETGS